MGAVKGLWHRLAPFASDTTGACVVFERQRALVIAQDSNGSVSVLRRVMDVNRTKAAYESIDLPEISYTLGREREFQERMIDLVTQTNAELRQSGAEELEFVVLLNGPVAALLGVDLQARARALSEAVGIPAIAVETTGNRFYDKGIEAAYETVYEQWVRAGEPGTGDSAGALQARGRAAQAGAVNFLGLTELDWPGREYVRYIAKWLNSGNRRVIADFGFGDSPKAWRQAPQAEENIVFSAAGLKLARRMEQDFGIPWRALCDMECFDTMAEGLHFEKAPRVLVIGEQVSANLVRRLLEKMGAGEVDVASFYMMDKKLKRPGDLRLKGESDLVRAAGAESGYDFAICDAALSKCAGVPSFPLMHPPSGFGARDNTELSREWLERLVNDPWV